MRRTEAERTGHRLAVDVVADLFKQLLVAVAFVTADIDRKTAFVGYHVVLCASLYDRNTHLYRTKQGRNLRKTIVAEPGNIVQYLVDGVVALLSCSMT